MTPRQQMEMTIKGKSLLHGHKPKVSHFQLWVFQALTLIVQFYVPVSQQGERDQSHKHAEMSDLALLSL